MSLLHGVLCADPSTIRQEPDNNTEVGGWYGRMFPPPAGRVVRMVQETGDPQSGR